VLGNRCGNRLGSYNGRPERKPRRSLRSSYAQGGGLENTRLLANILEEILGSALELGVSMKLLRKLGLICLGSGLVYWILFAIGVQPSQMFLIYAITFSATSTLTFVVFAVIRLRKPKVNYRVDWSGITITKH